jgi:hypothetical protein
MGSDQSREICSASGEWGDHPGIEAGRNAGWGGQSKSDQYFDRIKTIVVDKGTAVVPGEYGPA